MAKLTKSKKSSVKSGKTANEKVNQSTEKENPIRFLSFSNKDNIELSPKQKELKTIIPENEITFVTGPAGTSKTFTICYSAIYELLQKKSIDKIILTKPIVEAGENLGFLPGDVESKINPYMESYMVTMEKLIGKKTLEDLIKNGKIEMRPVAYMRGATFDKSFMIMDEAQNLTMKQLITYITRLGKNSRMVIAGDISQNDIQQKLVKLPEFIDMLKGINKLYHFKFEKEDIVRNPILVEIVDRYEKYQLKENNGNGLQGKK